MAAEPWPISSSATTDEPGIFVHDWTAINVDLVLNAFRLSLAWLGARDWLQLGRRRMPCGAMMAAAGPFIGADWLELEQRRSVCKLRDYRVDLIEKPLRKLDVEIGVFDLTILSGYPRARDLLAEE